MKFFLSNLLLVTLLSSCSPKVEISESETLNIAASIYPLAFFAEQIGGDLVTVNPLVPTGLEPHDFEPSPSDLRSLYDADLVVFNGAALEPWIEDLEFELIQEDVKLFEAVSFLEMLPASEESHEEDHEEESSLIPSASAHETGEEHEEWDPHVWLDPIRAQMIILSLANTLATLDPENAETYVNNAKILTGELSSMDEDFRSTLEQCTGREFVVSHAAFAYVANRYGLEMISISGLSPHDEPSLKDLEEITLLMNEHGLSLIYMEPLYESPFARTIGDETGAELLVLNPIEGLTELDVEDGRDYFDLMRENFKNLKKGLSCEANPSL